MVKIFAKTCILKNLVFFLPQRKAEKNTEKFLFFSFAFLCVLCAFAPLRERKRARLRIKRIVTVPRPHLHIRRRAVKEHDSLALIVMAGDDPSGMLHCLVLNEIAACAGGMPNLCLALLTCRQLPLGGGPELIKV